jgi:hypothetical protein
MTYTATDRIRITDAQYRKIRNYRIYRGLPTGLVPADTATQHIRALTALGWSYNALEQTIGGAVTGTTLANLGAQTHGTIERKTRAAALSLPYTLAPTPAVDDTALIPTLGAERRVKALLALGWTHDEMRRRGNVTVHLARGSYTQMLARRWRDIDAMYAELCMTPGPSRHTASRAAKVGYAPPLAWDDIDDPNEKPAGATKTADFHDLVDEAMIDRVMRGGERPRRLTHAEGREVYRRARANGMTTYEIEAAYGLNVERYKDAA